MSQEQERIAQQAAAFLVRSREETPAQRRKREIWLAQDPQHARIYQQLQQLDEDATSLLDDPELRKLIAEFRQSP
ncbi:DUF4880 domain-containing protein [Luteimonas sp. TWI1437]|uniref:FecR/PupR family sigma factor regulator n=1 Tax=unclassified Luteimonas TaxID=2629088 RepID=UPI00320B2AC0